LRRFWTVMLPTQSPSFAPTAAGSRDVGPASAGLG
jgi:hypothetical protein